MASVTFQNYFRLYDKLAGMTGTALTEAEEFGQIYGLGVVEVPTNRPIARVDEDDQVYRTAREKYEAMIVQIKESHAKGQPALVGTTSIEKSEMLSQMLKAEGIPHNVLNARQHEQEAQIVADAGKLGAVTIATNMAGRGTDIQLGGNVDMQVLDALSADPEADPEAVRAKIEAEHADEKQKVLEAGGLYVLASERHESRRIDNQLRGRSGRQGDPGRSSFYLSLEDDLMRLFATGALNYVMGRALPDDEAIEAKMVTKAIERAQTTVETKNAEIRKNVLKYDEVMNEQRKVIYKRRDQILDGEDLKSAAMEYLADAVDSLIATHCASVADDEWDLDALNKELTLYFPNDITDEMLAACRDTDPSLFFPVGTTGLAVEQIASAKASM